MKPSYHNDEKELGKRAAEEIFAENNGPPSARYYIIVRRPIMAQAVARKWLERAEHRDLDSILQELFT